MGDTHDIVNNSRSLIDKVQEAITCTTGAPFERIRRFVKDLYWPETSLGKALVGVQPIAVENAITRQED